MKPYKVIGWKDQGWRKVMSNDAAGLLREYLANGKLMQLATVSADGQPWLCHVWYAADDVLNLVFTSRRSRRHSRDINESGRVAGGIVSMPLEGLGQKVRGITFEGRAIELQGNSLRAGYETYVGRWPSFREMATPSDLESNAGESRLYQVFPQKFVLFDEVSFPSDPRQELTKW